MRSVSVSLSLCLCCSLCLCLSSLSLSNQLVFAWYDRHGWQGVSVGLGRCLCLSEKSCFAYTFIRKSPPPPKEAGDVWCLPLVWNLRLSFDSTLLPPLLFFRLVLWLFLSDLFSAFWPILLNFFQKILHYFSLRDRLNRSPKKNAYLLTKNTEEFSGKSSGEWASMQKKDRKSCRQAVQLVDKSQPCLFTLVYFIYWSR